MDATNGVPGRPLNWLPSGLTALILSLERTDSLAVQLKAFSVTQAVKALLSVKNSHKDFWGVPSPASGFNRSASLDSVLRELAKPFGGAGFHGGVSMQLSGFHSPLSGCLCESEDFCECNSVCGCGDPDCAACESCISEEDFEQYEEHYVPELQYQWGFPLAGSVMLNGPGSYPPKSAADAYIQVRRDSRLQRFGSKTWSNVQNFGWASPLERRAAFEGKEFAQSVGGGSGRVVEENVDEDNAQDSKEVSENSPSTRSAIITRRRKDARDPVHSINDNEGREEVLQSTENSIQKKKVEGSSQRINKGSEETQTHSESQKDHSPVNEADTDVKRSKNDVTSSGLQSQILARTPNWWPFGVQSAVAAVESGLSLTGDTTKWNFRMGQNAGAGALAGGVVSLCLHPIDTLKTIVQAQTGGSRNLLPILSSIISERGLKGLYRGLGSNLTSSAPISAIYTLTYEAVKAGLLRHIPEDMSALAHCAAGGCASVATSIVYTPSECVKQQMQVNGLYQNSWQAFTSMLKQGGLPMLYKGWGAVLCRNVPQSVIKFYTYEGLKLWAQGGQPRDTPLTTLQALAIGGVAGSTAAFFTTPFDVVKTRLQTQIPGSVQQYNGVIHAFQSIATTEGVAGLYRGLVPRLVIYVTQGALFFASYEFIKHMLAVEVPRLRIKTSQIEDYQRQPAPIPAEST
ncbi:hypothetical protein KC19_8G149300 [Ceratodon purpureus]|uniref:Mitochondrial substrate carrier family protein n=1 Tax=Ceratodon purpureus TaxID=3225 RepID=A0A8T0H751_CERPU|nr:hypothetical protein KC19_8G149300 [Ceratodon purpureus]